MVPGPQLSGTDWTSLARRGTGAGRGRPGEGQANYCSIVRFAALPQTFKRIDDTLASCTKKTLNANHDHMTIT